MDSPVDYGQSLAEGFKELLLPVDDHVEDSERVSE